MAVVCAVGCLLIFLASAGIATHRKRSGPKLTVEVEVEVDDDVLDVDDDHIDIIEQKEPDADIVISSEVDSEEPLKSVDKSLSVESEVEDSGSKRRRRRKARQSVVDPVAEELPPPPSHAEVSEELPLPPSPMELGTLPPPPGRDVTCDCGANFRVKSLELKYVKCPVCSERIDF